MHNFNHTIKCFSSKGYIYIKGGGRVEPGAGVAKWGVTGCGGNHDQDRSQGCYDHPLTFRLETSGRIGGPEARIAS